MGASGAVITNILSGNNSFQASRTASDRVLNLEGSWKWKVMFF